MGDHDPSPSVPPKGDESAEFVILGHITGAHGIKGWVKVHSDTSPRANIFGYYPWYIGKPDAWRVAELEDRREQGKGLVVKLAGCDDRDAADSRRGQLIAVLREQLPDDNQPGEYYWADLVGLQVTTVDGMDLGHIVELIETGSNDVMVVKGERDRLVPFIWEQVVREVDLTQRRMVVDWDPEF